MKTSLRKTFYEDFIEKDFLRRFPHNKCFCRSSSTTALSVGVIDSKSYNGTNEKLIKFPANLSDVAFTGKWQGMTEYVYIPVEELPTAGKTREEPR